MATAAKHIVPDFTELEWRQLSWMPDYEISEFGHLRRTRQVWTHVVGKVVGGKVNEYGYRVYAIRIDGRPKHVIASRLVCEAWHGPPPHADMHAAHCDGDRLNNHYSNLRWATAKDNCADKLLHGTVQRGENNARAKLTESEVREIRKSNSPNTVLARQYGRGLTKNGIQAIKAGRTWRHVV